MVRRGQTWGIISSGPIAVVLKIDRGTDSKGHIADFFIFEPNTFAFLIWAGLHEFTLANMILKLAAANLKAGIQSNAVIERLELEVQDEYDTYDSDGNPSAQRNTSSNISGGTGYSSQNSPSKVSNMHTRSETNFPSEYQQVQDMTRPLLKPAKPGSFHVFDEFRFKAINTATLANRRPKFQADAFVNLVFDQLQPQRVLDAHVLPHRGKSTPAICESEVMAQSWTSD